MGSVSLNTLIARYQGAFGFVGSNYANALFGRLANLPIYADPDANASGSEPIQLYTVADTTFGNVIFKNTKTEKTYSFGTTSGEDSTTYMAPPLMVSFSRDKNVVRTQIDRSETEVIEHFGLRPWTINIQGILIDQESHQYPSNLVKAVREMFNSWGTYNVISDLFMDLDISEIFFESGLQIGFVEGYADTVKFSVQAISVAPVEIRTKGV
jgi:hypothetical protein